MIQNQNEIHKLSQVETILKTIFLQPHADTGCMAMHRLTLARQHYIDMSLVQSHSPGGGGASQY